MPSDVIRKWMAMTNRKCVNHSFIPEEVGHDFKLKSLCHRLQCTPMQPKSTRWVSKNSALPMVHDNLTQIPRKSWPTSSGLIPRLSLSFSHSYMHMQIIEEKKNWRRGEHSTESCPAFCPRFCKKMSLATILLMATHSDIREVVSFTWIEGRNGLWARSWGARGARGTRISLELAMKYV